MSVAKLITYTGGDDILRRYYTLAELQDFVDQIVADNPGAHPANVRLQIEGGLVAHLRTVLPWTGSEEGAYL